MTKPANSNDKPSPADTPTHRPNDNGGKAVVEVDNNYTSRKLNRLNIAEKHEREEHPADPVKNPPAEKGVKSGMVQP
jgi:hypothetical protein